MKSIYDSPENFINRELSWLEFNERVLDESYDRDNPLFERLRFSAIVSSNLDEFFMVRIGTLRDQIKARIMEPDPSGLTPLEQLKKISARTHELIHNQYKCFSRCLKFALKKEGITFLKETDLDKEQKEFLYDYYISKVYPVLTPMVVDKSRPFPLILNKSLNIALLLSGEKEEDDYIFATVQVPSVLNRFIWVPTNNNEKCFVLLEDIIKMNLENLFSGHSVITSSYYRITRNADLDFDEEDDEDDEYLIEIIKQSIKQRKWGVVNRIEVEVGIDKSLWIILENELGISEDQKYEIDGPIDLTFLMKFINQKGFEYLRYEPIKPQLPLDFSEGNIFYVISKRDILLHHPYQSFDPVVNLVKQAAEDPNVLAIKQTLYRISGNSPIVEALAQAAENGKQVTVLVELKARFDEHNNIIWAERLEKSGCHVIYGLIGLKTHCKILLIVRLEEDSIKRYVHISTGNYNDITARSYTDLGLFTSNPGFGSDATSLFNMLSGHSEPENLHKFTIAPFGLRDKFLFLIRREAENARSGRKGRIIAKLNSLVDKEIIEALYEASYAGVNIDLIVRGICCLKPGIPGVSERITVRSIVGRFLEHSRIYYFYNDGEDTLFISSADWMPRNLDRRVELLFPVEDNMIKLKALEILEISLRDNVKARVLNSDGTYSRVDKTGKELINSQKMFYELALKEVKKK